MATLNGAALKTATHGYNSFTYGLNFFSFDVQAWTAAGSSDSTAPKSAQETLIKLPYTEVTGTTNFTASTASGDLTVGESAPYVIVTNGCSQVLYRVVSGTMVITSVTGSADTLSIVGTVDATFSGGSPAKPLTVKGGFVSLEPASKAVTSIGGEACSWGSLVHDYGLTLKAY